MHTPDLPTVLMTRDVPCENVKTNIQGKKGELTQSLTKVVSFCFCIINLNIRHIECAWKVQFIFWSENSSFYMVYITTLAVSV